MPPRSSSVPMAADQSQMIAVARRLDGCGAHRGALQVLFNAALQAEAKSAQVRDLLKGRTVRTAKPTEHLHAANDHDPASSNTA